MITLENEIVKSIMDDMTKASKEITASDVRMFFVKSQDSIKRLCDIKKLNLEHVKQRLATLKTEKEKEFADPKSVIESILNDLKGRLEIALVEFQNKKQNKHLALVKQLKLAVMGKNPKTILKALYDIESLNNMIKDLRIVELQDQILKYSTLAKEEGKVYLDFYTNIEKREALYVEVKLLTNEIQALDTILNTNMNDENT